MKAGRIIYVGGSKGGTGKSLVTIAVTDYLRSRSEDLFLIETDTENQDVAQAYKFLGDDLHVMPLREKGHWPEFINIVGRNRHRTVVVNTAAGSMEDLRKSARDLNYGLRNLQMELITLWPINRQRYVLNALVEFMDVVQHGRVHVLRNLLYGDAHRFVLFNGLSGLHQRVSERGGGVHDFPELADRVADRIYTDRIAVEVGIRTDGAAKNGLEIGDRGALEGWREDAHDCLKAFL